MEKQFDYKGAQINYTVQGKGRTIVFLHGFLCNHRVWRTYTEHLTDKFRVICIDLPGHGKSDSIGYLHSMELMADCIYELLRSIKARKVHLVGHSMGGYISLAFLEKYPDNCKSVTLFNSSAQADDEARKQDRSRSIGIIKKNPSLFKKLVVPNLFYTDNKPFKREIKTVLKMADEASPKGIVACQEGMKIRGNREMVVQFAPCPIHYIIGRYDQVNPVKEIEEEIQRGEKTTYYIAEEGGHMCMYEDKLKSLSSLIGFIKSVES